MQIVRSNQVDVLTQYKGYEAIHETFVMLGSGRQINSTRQWNPLTFALVYNKTELIDFIMKWGRNLEELLSIDPDGDPIQTMPNVSLMDNSVSVMYN